WNGWIMSAAELDGRRSAIPQSRRFPTLVDTLMVSTCSSTQVVASITPREMRDIKAHTPEFPALTSRQIVLRSLCCYMRWLICSAYQRSSEVMDLTTGSV